MHSTVHTGWCDKFHAVIGSPECSRLIAQVDELAVMLFGQVGHITVSVMGTDPQRPLSQWPNAVKARVIVALDEAETLRRAHMLLDAAQHQR